MKKANDKIRRRYRRKIRIRKKVAGTKERPRLTVYKSNRFVYLQVIDDSIGNTIVSASNKEKELIKIKSVVKDIGQLGDVLGQRLKEKNISKVVFDRNGYKYHGIIKAIADAVRKTGIQF